MTRTTGNPLISMLIWLKYNSAVLSLVALHSSLHFRTGTHRLSPALSIVALRTHAAEQPSQAQPLSPAMRCFP